MRDVAGLTMLVATAVIPVGVARAVLGVILAQLTRMRSATSPVKPVQPVPEGVPAAAPSVS